nr:class I SAM-dependent methyltransferase [Auraticoccus cholistanensis]
MAELPAGDALDAACGTGRLTRHLAARHRVVGVDSSPDMLRRAAARLPGVDLRLGELDRLPVADDAVDLVASTLALSHVGDLAAVMAEFARVLRPGGDLLVSDVHHELVLRGSVVHALGPDGEPGLVPTYRHTPGDFLRAALPAGFRVLACEEPRPARAEEGTVAPATEPGGWHDWPWSLMAMVPEASRIAWDVPSVVVWHFRLDR